MFGFFQAWLVGLAAAMAIAGGVLTLAVGSPLLSVVLRLLDRPFWPAGPDAMTRRFQAFAYGVTFATMAGWGTVVAFIAANGFASRQAWAWWAIAASVAVWYPLDTGRSLFHRVWVNAALNTVLLVLLAIPLAATFGEMR